MIRRWWGEMNGETRATIIFIAAVCAVAAIVWHVLDRSALGAEREPVDVEVVEPVARVDAAASIAVETAMHNPQQYLALFNEGIFLAMKETIPVDARGFTPEVCARLIALDQMTDIRTMVADKPSTQTTSARLAEVIYELARDPVARPYVLRAATPMLYATANQYAEAEKQQAEGREQVQKRLVEINTAITAEADTRPEGER